MKNLHAHQGFTLVEMATVLVVIGIVAGMSLSMGQDAIEATRKVATEKKLDTIEDALYIFRTQYNRLPCPAIPTLLPTDVLPTPFGFSPLPGTCENVDGTVTSLETISNGTTAAFVGTVPARTLGLPDEFMYDGWGKKFMYEVTTTMTSERAFSSSQVHDSCSIAVNSNATVATPLPTNAVYALVSHGKNGIGAYLAGGTRNITAGIWAGTTVGTDEKTNIHGAGYTTTPTIRIKNGVSGAIATAGYYDDIVRFKQRYQLMDAIDRSTAVYKGPEMIVTHENTSSAGSNRQLVYGKATCNFWQPLAVTIPALPSARPRFIAFTPDNRNLVAYFDNNCKLYNISNTTLTALTDFTYCPSGTTKGAMAKDSGTLALNDTASPYVYIYTLTGTGAAAAYTEVSNALSPALTYAPDNITLSANGEYLTVSKAGSTPVLYVKNADNSYNQTSAMPTGSGLPERSTAISPDGKYYALAEASGGTTNVYVYRNLNGVFSNVVASPTYAIASMTKPDVLSFSPDSHYLAVGGTTRLTVLYINPLTETVTAALDVTLATTPVSVAFSKDSTFIAAALGGISTNSISVYRRNNATAFNSTAETISSAFVFSTVPSKLSNYVAMSR